MPVTEQNKWKLNMVNELVDIKWGEAVVEGFESVEIDNILEELCINWNSFIHTLKLVF